MPEWADLSPPTAILDRIEMVRLALTGETKKIKVSVVRDVVLYDGREGLRW